MVMEKLPKNGFHEQLNSDGILVWLVVSTILKNISQWERLSHILWKTGNA
jgi:hypothetical protein